MILNVLPHYPKLSEVLAALRSTVGGGLVLLISVLLQGNVCGNIGIFCVHEPLAVAGAYFLLHAPLHLLVASLSTALCSTRAVHSNTVYNAVLMSDKVASLVCSICLYSLRHIYIRTQISSYIGRGLIYLLVSSAVLAAQRAVLFEIAHRTIWRAYLVKIKSTVFAQQVLASLTAFGEGVQASADKSPSHNTSSDMFSVHQCLSALEVSASPQAGGKLFDQVMHRLENCANGPEQPSEQRLFRPGMVYSGTAPPATRSASVPVTIRRSSRLLPHRLHTSAVLPPIAPISGLMTTDKVRAPKSRSTMELRHMQGALSESMAAPALHLFDTNEDGRITRTEFGQVYQQLLQQRTALCKTLDDYTSMMRMLNTALTSVSTLILLFVLLWVCGVDIIANRLSWLSLFVALSVAFGTTVQRFFEGCILVFVTRPFDVGDTVYLTGETESLEVVRLGLLSTQFKREDGQVFLLANSLLQGKSISNARRSAHCRLQFTTQVPCTTPLKVLSRLEACLEQHRVKEGHVSSLTVRMTSLRSDDAGALQQWTVRLYATFNWHQHAQRSITLSSFMGVTSAFLELEFRTGQQHSVTTQTAVQNGDDDV